MHSETHSETFSEADHRDKRIETKVRGLAGRDDHLKITALEEVAA